MIASMISGKSPQHIWFDITPLKVGFDKNTFNVFFVCLFLVIFFFLFFFLRHINSRNSSCFDIQCYSIEIAYHIDRSWALIKTDSIKMESLRPRISRLVIGSCHQIPTTEEVFQFMCVWDRVHDSYSQGSKGQAITLDTFKNFIVKLNTQLRSPMFGLFCWFKHQFLCPRSRRASNMLAYKNIRDSKYNITPC